MSDTLSIVNRALSLGVKVTAVFAVAVKVKVLNQLPSVLTDIFLNHWSSFHIHQAVVIILPAVKLDRLKESV